MIIEKGDCFIDKYKFSKQHRDSGTQDIQREIEDNLVPYNRDGSITLDVVHITKDWRIKISSAGDFAIEKKESGQWVEKLGVVP